MKLDVSSVQRVWAFEPNPSCPIYLHYSDTSFILHPLSDLFQAPSRPEGFLERFYASRDEGRGTTGQGFWRKDKDSGGSSHLSLKSCIWSIHGRRDMGEIWLYFCDGVNLFRVWIELDLGWKLLYANEQQVRNAALRWTLWKLVFLSSCAMFCQKILDFRW